MAAEEAGWLPEAAPRATDVPVGQIIEKIEQRIDHAVQPVRCHLSFDRVDVDRLLWCDQCQAKAKARASRVGWVAGTALAGVLSLYIWFWIQPSDLVIGGWIAVVVAGLWLGARLVREIAYGLDRFQNRPTARALPGVEVEEG